MYQSTKAINLQGVKEIMGPLKNVKVAGLDEDKGKII